MAKIKIEITEETGIKLGTEHYDQGDVVSADSDVNVEKYQKLQAAVNHGWAQNVDTGEMGERVPGAVKLKVDSVVQEVQ